MVIAALAVADALRKQGRSVIVQALCAFTCTTADPPTSGVIWL